jgi:predicted small lipoprotein YifL
LRVRFGPRSSLLAPRLAATALVFLTVAACGKKGPPLPPLNLAPEAPQSVAARRLGDTVYIQFTVPNKSLTGPGPFSVDHLEVFAATIEPGGPTPPNRELLKPHFMVAKIPVQPPPDPDVEPDQSTETDTRPKPGDTIAYVEKLTPQILEPQQLWKPPVVTAKAGAPPPPPPPAPAPVAAANPAAPAAAPPAAPPPPMLTRVYVVQGVAKNGSRGQPSARAVIPLLTAPGPARPGTTTFDAATVTITWQPPATQTDEAPGVTYNIYAAPAAGSGAAGVPTTAPAPLNAAPIAETAFSKPGAAAGEEQCFVVRSVATVATVPIESDPSDPMCVTPKDTFPPAAPKGLAAVAGAGIMNLIWDANTDGDLGGYIVLRGEAPGDTLQPLTPQPIRETRYVDRTVQPGVTYVYAVIAVDKATPPNQSALSNKVQETAR